MGLPQYIGLSYDDYDCWQFICHYYEQEFGIALPTFEGQYRDGDDRRAIGRIYSREMARKIWPRVTRPSWPDLAVFKIAGRQWHCGILVGVKHMLHIQRGCGSVIEKFSGPRWKNRLYGFYRYAGQKNTR